MPAVVSRTLAAAHVCVFGRSLRPSINSSALAWDFSLKELATGSPVVRHEDQNRIVSHFFGFKEVQKPPEVPVKIGNHPFEAGQTVAHAQVKKRLLPLLIDKVRAVWCVRRQVDKEWFAATRIRRDGRHEIHRLVEPDVGAISVELLPPVTVEIGVVEIIVCPEIRDLRQASAAMPDRPLKPLVHRTSRRVVAEVPLAKYTRGIPVDREEVAQRLFAIVQRRPSGRCSIRTGPSRITSRHQCCPSRRAERCNMKISKAYRLGMQSIDVWRLLRRIAMTRHITVTLIVGHDQHDVGTLPGRFD